MTKIKLRRLCLCLVGRVCVCAGGQSMQGDSVVVVFSHSLVSPKEEEENRLVIKNMFSKREREKKVVSKR